MYSNHSDPSGGTNELGSPHLILAQTLYQALREWKLAGVATCLNCRQFPFGSVFNRDTNTYVQISEYWETIQLHLPDTSTYAGWLLITACTDQKAIISPTPMGTVRQILEYAFQTNPNHPEPERAPNYFIGSTNAVDYFKYSLTRPSSLNNVSYSILTSTDLKIGKMTQSYHFRIQSNSFRWNDYRNLSPKCPYSRFT